MESHHALQSVRIVGKDPSGKLIIPLDLIVKAGFEQTKALINFLFSEMKRFRRIWKDHALSNIIMTCNTYMITLKADSRSYRVSFS